MFNVIGHRSVKEREAKKEEGKWSDCAKRMGDGRMGALC